LHVARPNLWMMAERAALQASANLPQAALLLAVV
jgi:hypothetical protein